MYLVTAATKFEMEPFQEICPLERVTVLLTGVGPVETTLRLTSFLKGYTEEIKGVINFGIGGAYVDPELGPKADLLEICLAEKEVLGDLGVCLGDRIERIDGELLEVPDTFLMDINLFFKPKFDDRLEMSLKIRNTTRETYSSRGRYNIIDGAGRGFLFSIQYKF